MGSSIELVSVDKRYGSFVAVKQVSLTIAPGEFVTLLGPSGSGKTTTLSAIAGFVEPTSGQVLIGGRRMDATPPEGRNIGVVFQHYALFPHMSVADNIAFPLEMRAMPRRAIATKVREALGAVHMSEFADRLPGQLSGGQQQRVALARAIVFDPPVLLLDEPLGALDRKLRIAMQIELKRLHARLNMTMVYVTHDQEEALFLSDRIAVMNRGRVEQIGKPGEIYAAPSTRFVAEFVGESNFLDATLEDEESGTGRSFRTSGGLRCVAANRTSTIAVGQSAAIMIRPERIVVGPGAVGLDNSFRGRIRDKHFLGGIVKYDIALTDTDSVIATVPSHADDQLSGESQGVVAVGWRARDTLAYASRPN